VMAHTARLMHQFLIQETLEPELPLQAATV